MSLTTYTLPPSPSFSRNPIRYRVGTDTPVNTVGLYIVCRVSFSRDAFTWEQQAEYPLNPNALGIVETDLQRIADRMLTYQLPANPNSQVLATDQCGYIRLSFQEYSAEDPEGGPEITLSPVLIVKGGLPHEQYQNNIFWQGRYPANKWLDWQPASRKVMWYQPDYVTYLHRGASVGDVELKVEVIFTDDTVVTEYVAVTGSMLTNELYHLPAGPANLIAAIEAAEAKTAHKYTITLCSDEEPITTSIAYTIDRKHQYDPLSMLYFNSLGGLSVLPIEGTVEHSAERESEVQETNTSRLAFNSVLVPAVRRINSVRETMTYKSNIGFTYSWELQDLRRELMLSREVYLWKNNRWHPIIIINKGVNLLSRDTQDKQLGIEWQYAWSNQLYAPENAVLGSMPGFEDIVSCPMVTITPGRFTLLVQWMHTPGPVTRYELRLADNDGLVLQGPIVKEIPFASPIAHTFDDLEAETPYKVFLKLVDTESGQMRDCNTYTATTLEDSEDPDPEPQDAWSFLVNLSDFIGAICSVSPVTVWANSPVFGAAQLHYDEALTTPVTDVIYVRNSFNGFIYVLNDGNPQSIVGTC